MPSTPELTVTVTTETVIESLNLTRLQAGDVLVIRVAEGTPADEIYRITTLLGDLVHEHVTGSVLVIMTRSDVELTTMDEATMALYGWVRARAPQGDMLGPHGSESAL